MNACQPSLHAQPNGSVAWKSTRPTGPYGIQDPLVDGLQKLSVDLNVSGHPLEYCEKHYHENREKNDFLMLRNIQGLHAPLRLKTEREIASRMQRLPGLPSSNLMSDILTGRLDTIDFEDFLCDPMDAEIVGQPHILMERRSGI